MPADSIPCDSLHSLDMDYDLWQGQFEIIAPYTEITNNNTTTTNGSNSINADNKLMSSTNGNSSINGGALSGGGMKPFMTSGRPITQILDSEDVFLSLHPSDFESLNIAAINNNNNHIGSPPSGSGGFGEDAAMLISRRQQQWNKLFPKSSVQSMKAATTDANGYLNENGNNSTNGTGSGFNNKSETTTVNETEALQHRLCEQVRWVCWC